MGFADGVVLLDKTVKICQATQTLCTDWKQYAMTQYKSETKTIALEEGDIVEKLKVNGEVIENVRELTYLSSTVPYDLDSTREITIQLSKAIGCTNGVDTIWKRKEKSMTNHAIHRVQNWIK